MFRTIFFLIFKGGGRCGVLKKYKLQIMADLRSRSLRLRPIESLLCEYSPCLDSRISNDPHFSGENSYKIVIPRNSIISPAYTL